VTVISAKRPTKMRPPNSRAVRRVGSISGRRYLGEGLAIP
jgi:hypothetical protein